jgi:NAD(P)-dependent dehydrogenase (short-subunit alcohol dehydrogenase family)
MVGSAVVTGAAQGIGAAIAALLAEEGRRVHGVDVDAAAARAWAARRPELDVAGHACDLGDPDQVAALWQRLDEQGEQPDVLVNDAGIFLREPALEVTVADWDRVLAVNLRGGFLMAQAFARRVRDREGAGAIVSVSSGQAYRPGSTGVAYAASKAGVSNLTRALALEWGPLGIRVNTVVPGLTDTAQPRATKGDDDFAAAAAANPIGRLSTPGDIAAMVGFLVSERASAITGQAFVVNGGRLML